MEDKMNKNIKITIDGRSFELPIDMSFFTGLMAPRPVVPRPMPQGTPAQRIQSSHERLEENFFRRIEQDLDTYRGFGDNEEARVLGAIVALHRRVRRLENCCGLDKPKEPQKVERKETMKRTSKPKANKPVAKKVVRRKTTSRTISRK